VQVADNFALGLGDKEVGFIACRGRFDLFREQLGGVELGQVLADPFRPAQLLVGGPPCGFGDRADRFDVTRARIADDRGRGGWTRNRWRRPG
jgi:hypothetical protein